MGKMFGQPSEPRLIKWTIGLLKYEFKNTFYLDHFRRKWFAVEFTNDDDDRKYAMANQPRYVCGQIFHLE